MSNLSHLYQLETVRQRCAAVAQSKLQYWSVNDAALPSVIDYILKLIKRDYGTNYASIRPHGRWSHFLAQGKDRIEPLFNEWKSAGVDKLEQTRRMIDLTVVSVLLDAGAGTTWKYTEKGGDPIGRSEGLAIASLDMFKAGLFSTGQAHQVDAAALGKLTSEEIVKGMQVGKGNEMPGADGRADLLIRLAGVLTDEENTKYFAKDGSARPGHLVDYLLASENKEKTLPLPLLWQIVIHGLAKVWPSDSTRTTLQGQSLGDAWPCAALLPEGVTYATATEEQKEQCIVPFHKLSQWLCYSLVEVIETLLPYKLLPSTLGTGLPEYRNGGLFVDFNVFKPNLPALSSSFKLSRVSELLDLPPMHASHPAIVEWRALTVCYLDKVHKGVCEALGQELSLAQVLEAGTWKAGREIAKEKRADSGAGSPVKVVSDGTVF